MNARTKFFDYVARKAERRVLGMCERFANSTGVFEEAHSIPEINTEVTREEAFDIVVEICCDIVAPDWVWQSNYDNFINDEEPILRLKRIR